ncbi:hypothetical protein PEPE_0776 [Pediococcus pentosaceus ATCC 25745]|uniref:Uncharacterized protein n=1 Tax=Pediococcus pentosaceus (strain ATCC 25745 / CCUG 21536 / LMG 10740 / 183-1w) TaxID=278197 RepID=Q03G35_PEDPA|nr:hypothetical protein [Pediococcus pentosaceus]ABJ67837.1 hypothetical protein PEPE_0776 [Pediococcus pentosaceus ATCC 25745]
MIFQIIVVILLALILISIRNAVRSINMVVEHLRIHDVITLDENEQKRMGNLYKDLYK